MGTSHFKFTAYFSEKNFTCDVSSFVLDSFLSSSGRWVCRCISRYQKRDSERFTFPKLQHEHPAEAGLQGRVLAAHRHVKRTETI